MASTVPTISLDDWHAFGRLMEFRRDDEVFYREVGDGPPLLMVHGFPTCGWDWAWIAPELESQFTLIIPDLLDYGFSMNYLKQRHSIFDQADMIEVMMRELGYKSIHILAHDVGDTVVQELLARRKEGVLSVAIESVVFLNGGLLPDHHRPRPIQKLLAGPLGPLIAWLMPEQKFMKGLKEVFGPNTQPDEVLTDCLFAASAGVNGISALARRIGYMKERQRYSDRWKGALLQPDVPMRLIDGLADPVSGAHLADAFEAFVPHADVVRLPTIGHFPLIEAPESVVDAFNEFHASLVEYG